MVGATSWWAQLVNIVCIFFLQCSARTRSLQATLSLMHTKIHVNGLLASEGPFFEKHIENAFNFSCKTLWVSLSWKIKDKFWVKAGSVAETSLGPATELLNSADCTRYDVISLAPNTLPAFAWITTASAGRFTHKETNIRHTLNFNIWLT